MTCLTCAPSGIWISQVTNTLAMMSRRCQTGLPYGARRGRCSGAGLALYGRPMGPGSARVAATAARLIGWSRAVSTSGMTCSRPARRHGPSPRTRQSGPIRTQCGAAVRVPVAGAGAWSGHHCDLGGGQLQNWCPGRLMLDRCRCTTTTRGEYRHLLRSFSATAGATGLRMLRTAGSSGRRKCGPSRRPRRDGPGAGADVAECKGLP